ncbi:VWA domain-containing protein [Actinomycetota bacterium]|nr:VWA domain-containing protein [Actinomycetota bacterium]
MTLTTPLVLLAFLALIGLIVLVHFILLKRRKSLLQEAQEDKNYYILTDVVASENDEFNKEIISLQRRYKMLTRLLTIGLVFVIIATAILWGRPGLIAANSDTVNNRDIVLCLDFSGSVLTYDKQILQTYRDIITNYKGERIGLQIFDSTSRIVFPLTDDYTQVRALLDDAISVVTPIYNNSNFDALDTTAQTKLMAFLAGTGSRIDSASLIGDGLMNCALQFGDFDQDRARSIIFATDNIMSGNPVFTLEDATTVIAKKKINLFTIFSGKPDQQGKADEQNLRETTENTDGANGKYFATNANTTVESIVNQINSLELAELEEKNETAIFDDPRIVLMILLPAFVIYLLAAWRLKR